jgi:hypothetical protein
MKIDLDQIDDKLIQELIAHCEDNMASPFKEKAKKKKLDLEAAMSAKEEPEVELESDGEDEMDEDSLRQLLEHYSKTK